MTRITSFDLAPFYRNSVGLDRLFDRIASQFDQAAQTTNYPPHNIIRINDDLYEICLAVAGFQQGEITVNMQEGNRFSHQDEFHRRLHIAIKNFEEFVVDEMKVRANDNACLVGELVLYNF